MNDRGLDKITIIIPTFCRPRYVLRQFEYWKNSDAAVVILDGSPEPLDVSSVCTNPKIRYVHSGAHFQERLATVRKYINTPYCAMLSDDEFYAFSGLHAALDRMEAEPEVIGCVGRCLYFFVDQGRFLMKDAYREWKPFSESASTPSLRLNEDLPPNKTHMAHYAIMRSSIWIQIIEKAYQKRFSSAFVYERLVNLQRAMLGRTEILESLLWFRSMENRNISNSQVGAPPFLDWALDSEFRSEVQEYRRIALGLLIEGGIPEHEAIEFERRFFEDGVELTRLRKSRTTYRVKRRLRRLLLRYSPKRFRLFAKRNVPNRLLSFSGWQGFGLNEVCDSLSSRGTSFDRAEIERVMQLSLDVSREESLDRESRVSR